MGAFIPIIAAPGNSTYGLIFDMSTGQFFNGATMEAYNLAHWGNYAQAAGPLSGAPLYLLSVSGSLPAGNYWVLPFTGSGAPSASLDTPLDILRFSWDGANVIELQSGLNLGKLNGSAAAAANLAVSAGALVTGAATAGTLSTSQMTTTLVATVANIYDGRVLIFTSGVNIGLAALITAYQVTGGKLVFQTYNNGTAPNPPGIGDTFVIL